MNIMILACYRTRIVFFWIDDIAAILISLSNQWFSRDFAMLIDLSVGRMVRYYFALAYKMVKMSKSAFLLKMEVPESENLS